jgi:SAM-dependent methyltransferase
MMQDDIRAAVLRNLEAHYGLKHITGTAYMRKGECPACGKRELFTRYQTPWIIHCGRASKCGQSWHVKELYPELFEDWSKRAPATEQTPTATARAYLQYARGFKLELLEGWYSQEQFYSHELGIGSATVRFALNDQGLYWERLIDQPQRFGKQKARFSPGKSYKGQWWCPPTLDLLNVKELWIVEGIFDAIALLHHGIAAVSAMSCNAFPEQALKELSRQRGGKLPALVWALDNDPAAHRYTRKWVHLARELGYTCSAAQVPQRSERKHDWNDLHQRWEFIEAGAARTERITADLKHARHLGALLIAESPFEKGVLLYDWRERFEFHFPFENRLYWFKMDLEKFHKAIQQLEGSERQEDALLNDQQRREKALRQCGGITEIANCYPQALYFQRNEVTDESWYYFRVDFPHDEPTVRNTFTGGQVAAASEFKKRLLGMAAGAVFTGSGAQLDKIMREQLFALKTVQTIDYIGYSKEHSCYVFGDLAVRGGVVERANAEDYFEFNKLRLKSLQRSLKLEINADANSDKQPWFEWLWQCFGAQGVIALSFWFGSLFAEQIRAQYQSFPFLEVTGEAGAGKSTLLMFLWKLLGRPDEEGKDPSKMSRAGLRRWLGQVSGMPLVLLEADRSDPNSGNPNKAFDFDEFKPLFNGGSLGVTGMKTGGNETHEPPFRGTLVMSQNATVTGSEAILTRIVKLHFVRPTVTTESRAAVDNLNLLSALDVSHFLLRAVRAEQQVLGTFAQQVKLHEASLRAIREIRVERIIKNHAQLLALLDALSTVAPITPAQLLATQQELMAMAVDRQGAINADPEEVRTFWEVYDYLESLRDEPVVNHSKKPELIAINLNEFAERAAEHRQKLADVATLRTLLKNSRSRPCVDANRATDSAVRATYNAHNPLAQRATTVKCWVFKA